MNKSNKQTVTKTISLIFDVEKDKLVELEAKWQAHLAGELSLAKILEWLKKWQVESLLR
jgi:hypothetical protein